MTTLSLTSVVRPNKLSNSLNWPNIQLKKLFGDVPK
ncbi:hypothetical protein BVRB_040150 [Beta vulgaris subsp. vulgaris]|uniref:Uncharacterized protein n=1 Tax=Beta vulgaris subsp. vulgaris TaxID=3555 RepID=A0A0J8BH30_BETVV|nr:hypothetical protein BVRB_040150 [Beta vulgaris subsp. vulgaris]